MTAIEALELCLAALQDAHNGGGPVDLCPLVDAAVIAAKEGIAQEKQTVIEIIDYVGEWERCADGHQRQHSNGEIIGWLGRKYLGYE